MATTPEVLDGSNAPGHLHSTGDQVGKVESHGIDRIPDDERHGKPSELFLVWGAANVNYLFIVLGGLLTLLGLNIVQGIIVVVVGNLFWILIGLLAVSGPVSGTPSSVITRSMFGIRGNRLYVAIASWPIYIAYEAVNLAVGALAAFAFTEQLGFSANRPVQIIIVAVIALSTLALSIYGHATIVRMSGFFTVVLTVCMVVLGLFIVANADFGYIADPAIAPSGIMLWATALGGVALIASTPISWGISADYARYLPANTSKFKVALFTTLGGFVPSVILGSLGVLAGSVVDMSNPQQSLSQILPIWFYPIYLLLIVVGSVTNNVLTMYSSGLALLAIGFPVRRSVSVLIDGTLGVALACYALFISNFIDTLSSILEVTVAVLGPAVAIYATDLLLRRNRYNGFQLSEETKGSTFWYHRGFNMAGIIALVVGTGAAVLCLYTTYLAGAVALALGGTDISIIAGPLVAAGLYWWLQTRLYGWQTTAEAVASTEEKASAVHAPEAEVLASAADALESSPVDARGPSPTSSTS